MPAGHNGFRAGHWSTAIIVALGLVACSERRNSTVQGNEMRVALTDLAGAEDVFYATNLRYSAEQSTIVALTLPSGVTITIDSADEHGWRASATHEYGVETCYVSGRNDGSSALATVEGPTCKPLAISATLRDVRGRTIVPPTPGETDSAPEAAEARSASAALAVPQGPLVMPEGISLMLPVADSQTEVLGYPAQTVDRLAVRQLLLARAYDVLDRVLTAYADSVKRDYRLEYRLFDSYGSFAVAIPEMEPRLTEWVRLRPRSVPALLARANYYRASGWHERGTGYARETSAEQFARMRSFFERSITDLTKAHRLDSTSIVAYRQMIDIATSDGDRRSSTELVRQALKLQPYSFVLRAAHMYSLLPRWGGSYEAMEEFAEESMPYAKRNPRIKALRGFVDWDRGSNFESDDQKGDAIEAYHRAIRLGDLWQFRSDRGEYYWRADLNEEALEDFNTALLQYPQNDDILSHRASVEYELARHSFGQAKAALFSQAFRDIELAVAIDPTDESHQKDLAFYRKNIPGYAPPHE
jgi:tetratricopeptide (TPR) repeat protein